MKRFSKIILALLSLVSLVGVPMAHSSTYRFTTFDVPGYGMTTATGINNQSQIVGFYQGGDGNYQGFLLSGGTFTTFDMPGTIYIQPFGIDDQGQIVGIYTDPYEHGFIYTGGNFTTFDIPITIEGAIPVTYAYGVSGQGEIVGRSMEVIGSWGYNDQGFIRNVGGGYTFFNLGLGLTLPYGINDQGQTVGIYLGADTIHGFLREKSGGYIDIDFPGAEQTDPEGINDNGQIVGYYYYSSGGWHSFIYEGGNFTTIDVPGARHTVAMGINNQGQIVGYYISDDGATHSFLASVNRPPILDPIGSKTINEGELLQFTITATDPDGDALTYSASNLPTGATFDPGTQVFSWTPDYGRAGSYPGIHFEVTDGNIVDSEDIIITVNALVPLPDLTGEWLEFTSYNQKIIEGKLSIRNIGTKDAGRFKIANYLSDDSVLGGGDMLIGTLRVNSLLAGESKTLKFRYRSKVSLQGKFIIAVFDSDDQVSENDEGNNIVPSPQIQ